MSSPLRASLITLRTGFINSTKPRIHISAATMGQRLFSQLQTQSPQTQTQTQTTPSPVSSNYKVEPLPKNLIPSLGQSKQQILWLGCSDSGYEETTTLNNLLQDEMIVVRNWGNMALSTDLAWASAVQHAVDVLEVKHIIVCGHYGCGIVKSDPVTNASYPWQKKISNLLSTHQHELESLADNDRNRHLVELNVIKQMESVRDLLDVVSPGKNRRVNVHGFIYDRKGHSTDRIVLN
ncbi:carbonate dehydratase, putative [Talaromyces stipitatus ATCC 10500]|uniref:Carbonic anhydrase n=1 Tax=Talaromyces stipitatus (strain ATCC 10500 / CBS 375.48 / QM 6759 / NRRL 1006) TaxID=441959 RepID=B8MEU1_TALSN|nr:carbonate dehydratase, putative [Talaromyces stipitatus ATCC 10500]EED16974.1 carbonate dehydratase, putative [Talaromyces stipitatus ATCC 10500]